MQMNDVMQGLQAKNQLKHLLTLVILFIPCNVLALSTWIKHFRKVSCSSGFGNRTQSSSQISQGSRSIVRLYLICHQPILRDIGLVCLRWDKVKELVCCIWRVSDKVKQLRNASSGI